MDQSLPGGVWPWWHAGLHPEGVEAVMVASSPPPRPGASSFWGHWPGALPWLPQPWHALGPVHSPASSPTTLSHFS